MSKNSEHFQNCTKSLINDPLPSLYLYKVLKKQIIVKEFDNNTVHKLVAKNLDLIYSIEFSNNKLLFISKPISIFDAVTNYTGSISLCPNKPNTVRSGRRNFVDSTVVN